jgi:hypothetical protein
VLFKNIKKTNKREQKNEHEKHNTSENIKKQLEGTEK